MSFEEPDLPRPALILGRVAVLVAIVVAVWGTVTVYLGWHVGLGEGVLPMIHLSALGAAVIGSVALCAVVRYRGVLVHSVVAGIITSAPAMYLYALALGAST